MAELLVNKEWDVRVYDLSKTDVSFILGEIFRTSHLVLAAATHDGKIFEPMEHLLQDMAAHNVQRRTVGLIENGSWAPVAAKQMQALLEPMQNMHLIQPVITIKSSLSTPQEEELNQLVTNLISA